MNLRGLVVAAFALGCASQAESEPLISAEQAQGAFTGTWSGTFTRAGRPDGTLTLTLKMANPVPTVKCGSHVLSTKCIDTTSVRLAGTLTTSNGAFTSAAIQATMQLYSASNGQLEIASPRVWGAYHEGAIHDGTVELPDGRAQFKVLTRQ